MKALRKLALWLALVCSCWGLACSYVLDIFANPGAPSFELQASREAGLDRLAWPESSLSLRQPEDYSSEGRERSWEMLYGYYVFASTSSPYDGYQLVARLLNPETINRTWTNLIWKSRFRALIKDFTPRDGLSFRPLASQVAFSVSASDEPVFYRVAVISLKRIVTELRDENDERLGDEIVHELGQSGVSGWVRP